MVTFLSGGTGTPKLLWGASTMYSPDEITVIGNTGDDIELGGLHMSPDIDTVIYERAGMLDRNRWWAVADDTTITNDRVEALATAVGLGSGPNYLADEEQTSGRPLSNWRRFAGVPEFMTIGEMDRAHHLVRTALLEEGRNLTSATRALADAYEVSIDVLPMSDDPVATMIETPNGILHFQSYWVAHGGAPTVTGVEYRGATTAEPTSAVRHALADPVIIGPANPVTSIGPMLAMNEFDELLRSTPVVAVSPFIGKEVFSGPAAELLAGTGYEPSTAGVANALPQVDGFVLDEKDTTTLDRPTIRTSTHITSESDAVRVTEACNELLEVVS